MSLIYAERKGCYLLKGLFFAIKPDGWIKGKGRISLKAPHSKVSVRDTSLQVFPLNRRQSVMSLSLDLNSVFYVYKDGESYSLVLMLARYASPCQMLFFPLIQKIHLLIMYSLSLLCTLILGILKTSLLISIFFFLHDFSTTVASLLIQRITAQAFLLGTSM